MKTPGYVLVAVGIILVVVGLLADSLGIGGAPGLGWKQITIAVLGVIAAVAGFWMVTRKSA